MYRQKYHSYFIYLNIIKMSDGHLRMIGIERVLLVSDKYWRKYQCSIQVHRSTSIQYVRIHRCLSIFAANWYILTILSSSRFISHKITKGSSPTLY
jgi:hypothetical protein